MVERARFMARQPGFISITCTAVSMASTSPTTCSGRAGTSLVAAHHTPEFRDKWPQVGQIAEEIELSLYEVAHVEE